MWEETHDLAAGLREKSEFPRWTSLCPPLAGPGCCGVTGVLSGEGGVTALPDQEESFLKVPYGSSLRAVIMSDLVRLWLGVL